MITLGRGRAYNIPQSIVIGSMNDGMLEAVERLEAFHGILR